MECNGTTRKETETERNSGKGVQVNVLQFLVLFDFRQSGKKTFTSYDAFKLTSNHLFKSHVKFYCM